MSIKNTTAELVTGPDRSGTRPLLRYVHGPKRRRLARSVLDQVLRYLGRRSAWKLTRVFDGPERSVFVLHIQGHEFNCTIEER